MIGDTEVRRGTYGLMAVPGESEWKFVLHRGTATWGIANHNDEWNVASVMGAVSTAPQTMEALSMTFDKQDDKNVHLVVAWENTMVRMPISMK